MNKFNLLAGRAGWLALLVVLLAGCVAVSTQETATTPLDTLTPAVTQIPPPATYTPSPTAALSPTLSPATMMETPASESSIPLCTFASDAAPEVAGPSLDDYVFSDPRVVLTHTSAIGIVGWLPDGERLLISRRIPQTNRRAIETFNTHTGELCLYAEQKNTGQAFWLPQSQVVAFVDWEYVDKATGKTRRDLWISQGTEQVQRLVEGIPLSSTIIEPSGYLILFTEVARSLPETSDAIHQFFPVLSMPIDPSQWQYPKYPVEVQPGYVLQQMSAARRPDGSQIAFYTDPFLFLVDAETDQACEVDLGRVGELPRWASYARWSSDGRYLAMRTTARLPGNLLPFSHLTVLDATNGKLYQPDLDIRYIWDIAWSPNSRHLMALGEIEVTQTGRPIQKLYLVDVLTKQWRPILPDQSFGGGAGPGSQLAWSSDGHNLAIECPLLDETERRIEDRLCLILTHVQP